MKPFGISICLLALSLLLPLSPVRAEEELFQALSAQVISDCEIVVTFSEPLNEKGIGHPYTALRRCYINPDGSASRLAWDGDTPLQAGKEGWSFYGDDRTAVVVQFEPNEMKDFLSPDHPYAYYDGYVTFFAMEELNPADDDPEGSLFDVVSKDGKRLEANVVYKDCWDGCYLPITYAPGLEPETRPMEVVTFPFEDLPETAPVTHPTATSAPIGTEGGQAPDQGCAATAAPLPLVLLSSLLLLKKKNR